MIESHDRVNGRAKRNVVDAVHVTAYRAGQQLGDTQGQQARRAIVSSNATDVSFLSSREAEG